MSDYEAFSQAEITAGLKGLPKWKQVEKALVRVKTFPNYLNGIAFVSKVGHASEKNNHHPDILINYKRVEVRYWTHKARGITALDFKMAHVIEKFLA